MPRAISENRFHEHYRPQLAPSGDLLERADTMRTPLNHVWTIVEGDDGQNLYALPGYHLVNRLGYVTTELPWTDEARPALYFGRD